MRERGGKNTDKENLGELWDIYYNNRSCPFPQPKFKPNKLASPEAMLVRNYDLLTESATHRGEVWIN